MSSDQTSAMRALADANARVAEATAVYLKNYATLKTVDSWDPMVRADRERTAALAALEDAKRPKLLTPAEAYRIMDEHQGSLEGGSYPRHKAVLTAAHERAFAVIEALSGQDGFVTANNRFVSIIAVKRALGLTS